MTDRPYNNVWLWLLALWMSCVFGFAVLFAWVKRIDERSGWYDDDWYYPEKHSDHYSNDRDHSDDHYSDDKDNHAPALERHAARRPDRGHCRDHPGFR